jgi:hypothetical protein
VEALAAVLAALFLAVHVSVPGVPAPAPVLLVFAAVISALCYAIWTASGCRLERRAAT